MSLLISFFAIQNLSFASFPIAELMSDPNDGLYKTVGYLMGKFLLVFRVIIAYAYNDKTMLKSDWKGILSLIGFFVLYITFLFVLYSYFPDDF